MEVFHVNNEKYMPKCPKCSNIVRINIDYNTFNVSADCKECHNIKYLSSTTFYQDYIKRSLSYKYACFKCFNNLRDDSINYKCQICNKLYCPYCITSHEKETEHTKVKFIQKYELCKMHNQKYYFYCGKCRTNLCLKCKEHHKVHKVEFIFDLIPNNNVRNSVQNKINEFEKRIEDIISLITSYKSEIIKRYNKIYNFLKGLTDINEKLLINFNNEYFDYYNYENYNYLLNSLTNEDNFESSKYINYLTIKDGYIQDVNENITEIYYKEDNNLNYIKNPNSLKYIKDNIFFIYENNYLKIFDFKDFSFNQIISYNLEKYCINDIEPAKYSNNLFLKLHYPKKIKFLEYDIINKTIQLSQKEINGLPKEYSYFYECFDLKNGNILVWSNEEVFIWKKDQNNNNFTKFFTITNVAHQLTNINSNLFCFQDDKYNLKFYDTDLYQCNKIIKYNDKIKFLGIINNKLLVFHNYYLAKYLIFIDVKLLEVVQIAYNKYDSNFVIINDNYFYNFEIVKNNLEISKREFNLKEKYIKNVGIMSRKTRLNYIFHLLVTDTGYVIICDHNNIVFMYLN